MSDSISWSASGVFSFAVVGIEKYTYLFCGRDGNDCDVALPQALAPNVSTSLCLDRLVVLQYNFVTREVNAAFRLLRTLFRLQSIGWQRFRIHLPRMPMKLTFGSRRKFLEIEVVNVMLSSSLSSHGFSKMIRVLNTAVRKEMIKINNHGSSESSDGTAPGK